MLVVVFTLIILVIFLIPSFLAMYFHYKENHKIDSSLLGAGCFTLIITITIFYFITYLYNGAYEVVKSIIGG